MKSTSSDLDSPNTTLERVQIIQKKKFLKRTYEDFYGIFKTYSKNLPLGKKVEIGSGAGFLKKIMPDVVTSDIMKLPNCDMVVSAEKMPFRNSTLSGIYMLNTFHHIKNPKKALSEFSRCLKKGGRVIMVEPYNSLWGRFIYKNFHHEVFDPKGNWKIQGKGDLSDANGALPWIVFVRDKKKFEKLYPSLKILETIPHTPTRYILSGGFVYPQLVPLKFYNFSLSLEKWMSKFNKYFAMFVTIVIEKV